MIGATRKIMNNKIQHCISCLCLMAGLLMALPAFAEHTLVLFDENFDRSIPVYGVALCKPEQKSTKKPIRVYFSRYSDAQEEYMPVEVNAKDLTIKKDHMVPVKFENMQEIENGWRIFWFKGLPGNIKRWYILKSDKEYPQNLCLIVDDKDVKKEVVNDKEEKPFSVEYSKLDNVKKSDFTTPEAADYTLLNTKTMSVYKYKCEYFAEGVIRVYFGNGDYATFSDEKVFCNGENDRYPGHNAYSIGDWQLTSEDGYIVKQENGIVTIDYPNGCKVINRKGKDLYWDVNNAKPIVYTTWFYGDLLEVPSKTEPLKWVEIKAKSRNQEGMNVSGYLDGDRLYAQTPEGQYFPFIQIVENNIPFPAIANDTIVKVQTDLDKDEWGHDLPQYTIHYKNGDEVVADGWGTIKSGSIHRNGGLFTIKEVNNRIIKTLTFANGDKFIGDVKLNTWGYPMSESGFNRTKIDLTALAWPELQLWEGTLIKADGTRIEYKKGKTEQQIAAERKAKDAQAMAEYNKLCQQYGKKYVDAALCSNPIIGMPEELLKKFFNLKLIEEGNNYKLYRITGLGLTNFGTTLTDSATLYSIWVSNGRVTDIRHW